MKKLPKLPLSKHYFVGKITSEVDSKIIFELCSTFVSEHTDKYYGFYIMNYAKREPKLAETLFFIFGVKNRKNKAVNFQYLKNFCQKNDLLYLDDYHQEVNAIINILDIS